MRQFQLYSHLYTLKFPTLKKITHTGDLERDGPLRCGMKLIYTHSGAPCSPKDCINLHESMIKTDWFLWLPWLQHSSTDRITLSLLPTCPYYLFYSFDKLIDKKLDA